jgi:hypothetical protein
VNTTTTVTDPCPYCGGASGVQSTPAPAGVQSWSCTECGLDWAITVVINPHLRTAYLAELGAAVEEIGRLRWTLRQIISSATDASQLADVELRARLLVALAVRAAR